MGFNSGFKGLIVSFHNPTGIRRHKTGHHILIKKNAATGLCKSKLLLRWATLENWIQLIRKPSTLHPSTSFYQTRFIIRLVQEISLA